MASILIVDDDDAMRDALSEAARDLGYDAHLAASGAEAISLLHAQAIDAALLDLRMPGMEGIEVLKRLRALPNPPPVTVLTAHATAANTIEAMRLGAFDHLTKPIGREEVSRILAGMLAARAAPRAFRSEPEPGGLIGSSEPMRTVQKTIGMLADSNATVLISGETGTGKELVARAIHEHGHRSSRPFIPVNCAAIPAELMESELFGHVRGAFTGAVTDRKGAFREAERGTLFLDEIGDMEIALQAKILRALQERVVTPVGGKAIPVDVRVIAATHRDLKQRVRDGSFREDLFYRLHVVPIHLPALRERIADIVPLAEYFLARAGGAKQLAPEAAARLVRHAWPGNVRELKNAMERAAALVRSDAVNSVDLDFIDETRSATDRAIDWPDEDLPSATSRLEEMLIRRALARSEGNRAEAARLLGIHRQLLYTKMKRYGLDASEDRTQRVGEADIPTGQPSKK
ncbi:sigma-54-dependent transcriptional regulator [Beijerinckia indica]|uniref:Two component, sigma54 specific, transcriptional regulator, Fis family n=1 Tax=Beijerinckia indica subsp. indica (strain ATCC 9039 / DSM 1715 / NCIMB 8712) TaxID=395963 RepID=B2IL22_BEII9|nr:sigma-54 dependent transcriptional regulator [Beijerinckia indica]ACB96562.1 two component, sigma54 specific, transcriptional regulator, Fis family [Beijerinckia indica subsp. indica ATCC 9039]